MSYKNNLFLFFLYFVCIIIAIISLFAIIISYISYDVILPYISSLSHKKYSLFYTKELHNSIVYRLRIAFILTLLIVPILFYYRYYIANNILNTFSIEITFIQKLVRDILKIIGEDGIYQIITFAIIFFIGVYSRVIFINQPMQCDESATFLFFALKPLYISLGNYIEPNNHIFHTILIKLSVSLFGSQPWAIRLPTFLAGILLIIIAYITCRYLYGKETAIISIAFIASSSHLIEYSINARGYSIICALSILTFFLINYIMEKDCNEGWVSLSILWAIGFYTIPTMLYPIAAITFWSILSEYYYKKNYFVNFCKNMIFMYFIMTILIIIFYFPVLATFGIKSIIGNKYVLPMPFEQFLKKLPLNIYNTWQEWVKDMPTLFIYFILIGLIISIIYNKEIYKNKVNPTISFLFIILSLLVIQRVVPYERVWLFLLPFVFISASAGICYISRKIFNKIKMNQIVFLLTMNFISIIICGTSMMKVINNNERYFSEEKGAIKNPHEIASILKDLIRKDDYIKVVNANKTPLEYYFYIYDIPLNVFYNEGNTGNRREIIIEKKGFKDKFQNKYEKYDIIYEDDDVIIFMRDKIY